MKKKYDIATIEYDVLKSQWLSLMVTLVYCSMNGTGLLIEKTKTFLKSIFSEYVVEIATWLARVMNEVHNGSKSSIQWYLKNFNEAHIRRIGLVQPYNIGLWMASIVRDFDTATDILKKIPTEIYNAHTYAMIAQCYRHQKLDLNRHGAAFVSLIMNLSLNLAMDVINGKSAAGPMEADLPPEKIEERFLINYQIKEVLCLGAKEALRNVSQLKTQNKEELQTALDRMFYIMQACCLNGYAVDEKELEVAILTLANNYVTIGAQCNDRALVLAQYYLKDARPNNFKAILILLVKLSDNYLFAKHVTTLWRQHSYQIYLRFLHESLAFSLMRALETEGHFRDAIEYFILVVSPRNGLSLWFITDEKVWAVFIRCCRHLLLDELANVGTNEGGIKADEYFQRAVNCLWKARKLSDLGLLSCLLQDLCNEELFDYARVLLEKLHEELESYGTRDLKRAMTKNGLEGLIAAIEHIMEKVKAQSHSAVFASPAGGKAFQRTSADVLNILMGRKADARR